MDYKLNADEGDTLFELVTTIFFMLIGFFAISRMINTLEPRSQMIHEPDKITITSHTHYAEDPFYLTGYQAYMVSWHMDNQSTVPVTWIGGTPGSDGNSNVTISGPTDKWCTIRTIDSDGHYLPGFYREKANAITGADGRTQTVAITINSVYPGNQTNMQNLYKGSLKVKSNVTKDGELGNEYQMFHLSLGKEHGQTTDFATTNGGFRYIWTIAPSLHWMKE